MKNALFDEYLIKCKLFVIKYKNVLHFNGLCGCFLFDGHLIGAINTDCLSFTKKELK
jgi:hypothetical protein